MNIKHEIVSVDIKVLDYRGYKDMISSITIDIDFIDTDTQSTIGYQLFYEFDKEIIYDDKNKFKPFDEIDKSEIDILVKSLIERELVRGFIPLQEWVKNRFEKLYS